MSHQRRLRAKLRGGEPILGTQDRYQRGTEVHGLRLAPDQAESDRLNDPDAFEVNSLRFAPSPNQEHRARYQRQRSRSTRRINLGNSGCTNGCGPDTRDRHRRKTQNKWHDHQKLAHRIPPGLTAYALRRPRMISTAPATNANAAAPVVGSISGTGGGPPAIATAAVPRIKGRITANFRISSSTTSDLPNSSAKNSEKPAHHAVNSWALLSSMSSEFAMRK